jgi:isochorismate synthase
MQTKRDMQPGETDGATPSTLRLAAEPAPLLDPLRFLQTGARRFYARLPDEGIEVAGEGWAWAFQHQGTDRFVHAQAATGEFLDSLDSDVHLCGLTPRLWGGFSFQPALKPTVPEPGEAHPAYPDAHWFLPARQYLRHADKAFYLTAAQAGAVARPPMLAGPEAANMDLPAILSQYEDEAAWGSETAQALRDILGGNVRKLVLARAARLSFQQPLSPAALLQNLRSLHPRAAILAFEMGRDDWFITVTPERLLQLRSGILETHGVAGTIGRGASPAEDEALRRHLLTNPKEQEEHDLVVASILQAIGPFCADIDYPRRPAIMEAGLFYHLVTSIRGAVRADNHLFRLAAALHPTAAVGGFPKANALAWLARHESLHRGWYAAPVGYVDSRGEGALFVAIRSGRFSGTEATLYAGAGLVRGSDADAEWRETVLKLGTLLEALKSPRVSIQTSSPSAQTREREDATLHENHSMNGDHAKAC